MEGATIPVRIRDIVEWAELLPPHHLLRHVASNESLSRDIFGTSPRQMTEHLKRVRTRNHARREEVAAVLRRSHARLGASASTLENLDRLAQPTTFVVIGGQQPGLFTGPLYTVYKAISIIKLAEDLRRQFPYEFVPLFWNASDDHDWAEVDHAHLIDGAGHLQRLEYPLDRQFEGWSVGEIPLGHGALAVIQRLSESLAGQGFADAVEALLLETAEVSSTFGEWFSRLMLSLFHRHGLIMVEPGLPELKRLAVPLFEQALEAPLVPSQLANETGDALEERGFQRQLHKDPTLCSFFLRENGRREAVHYSRGAFRIGPRTYTKAELKTILQDSPERFSPNALLRPVMSEFLFPTAAFVGGAGELNYFAQTRRIYEYFDVPMPVPHLRLGCTLIEPAAVRILEKYHTPPLTLRDPDRALTEWIRARMEFASPALWQGLREQVYRPLNELKPGVRAIDPTLETSLEGTLNYMMFRIGKFEKKLVRHLKKAEHLTATQLRRAAEALFPGHGLQERTLNGMSYLSRYGMDLVDRLVQAVPASYGKHFMVELS
ncbi:MAG TPA: bacillithiol biosynthesis cysteine-adding enzyme BshC [Candidatus Tectomicrobia bacterium]|nr:bacillithiol biosynthesis cysteine-adding enzyme BshC [Candidatus Tectomicrobia bacterium]